MQNNQQEKKLKPVTFISGRYQHNAQNTSQQIMLLNALKITQDPNKLRQMIGVKTVADVFRTLDKMSMRKEYHKALDKHGISFDYVVDRLKKEIDAPIGKAGDRIKALNMLMKSVGIDKYEDSGISGGSWEDALLKAGAPDSQEEIKEIEDYEVKVPELPESLREIKEKEKKVGKSLYE